MAIAPMMDKPIFRSSIRIKCGMIYYGLLRRLLWLKMHGLFAAPPTGEQLPYLNFRHQVPLMRKLRDVDMWYQHNKVINLKLATPKLSGLILEPGQVFSYWKLIGKPSRHKGYVAGMVLRNGTFTAGVGGGLCQLSNLIFWMTLHTPLTILERHRHGYDVFPDADRNQPFGSGATCFYPHGDLMLRNDTPYRYQLLLTVGETTLDGAWYCDHPSALTYRIIERGHEMRGSTGAVTAATISFFNKP